ncbi:hypothetical protein [Streptomyces sp. NPDC001678]|uniref:hypothetical protein n=1 Tax=Streptomyces sp. NPDC001678 TaxID=3364599 RepID=UPI0036A962DE
MAANREVVLELECDANNVGSATVLYGPNGTTISAHGAGLKAVVVRDLDTASREN